MKLMAFDTESKEENVEEVSIHNMCILYASFFDMEDDSKAVRFVYAAHTSKPSEVLYFARFFSYTEEDDDFINQLREANLFIDENSYGLSAEIVKFYSSDLGNDNKGITSPMLIDNYDQVSYYSFFNGIIQGDVDKIVTYSITRAIRTGMEIIDRCIATKNVNEDAIIEANLWMSNDDTDRQYANYYTAETIKVEDVSRSIKMGKNEHVGVAILNIYTKDDDTNCASRFFCNMTYTRPSKLRDRSKTLPMEVLQDKYPDTWNILPFGGFRIDKDPSENMYTMIIINDKGNSAVISVSPTVFNEMKLNIDRI